MHRGEAGRSPRVDLRSTEQYFCAPEQVAGGLQAEAAHSAAPSERRAAVLRPKLYVSPQKQLTKKILE